MGYYDYGYSSAADSVAAGVGGFFLMFLLSFYLLMFAFGVVSYILTALGMYTIAKRRGIHYAWLAWIPVADYWLLGSISDQYQHVAKNRVRNRRKVLLGLVIAIMAVTVLTVVGTVAALIAGSELMIGGMTALVFLAYLAIVALTIVLVVFFYIALYDLYASCDPDNAVLYLVLSVLFAVAMPFFIFACRTKDKGMPPRKVTPQPIPAPEPVVQTPVAEEEPVLAEEEPIVEEQEIPETPAEVIVEPPAQETEE